MICRVCGKENHEDAKYCTSCGAKLKEEVQICPSCGTDNVIEAQFCKKCGFALDSKKICPSCGLENKREAKYCKACGTALKKTNGRNIGRFVFNIVSLSLCGFIILYCFAATFTDFLSVGNQASTLIGVFDESNLNLFKVIEGIKKINSNSIVKACGDYGKVAYLIPSIISLLGILTAMLGCFVILVLAIIRSILMGTKKKLPNLERYAVMSTGLLFAGLLIVSLNNFGMNMSDMTGQIGHLGFHYGSVVLSALCIGIIWMFACHIAEFVFRCVEGCNRSEIKDRIFKAVEGALLIVLLFNLAGSFAKISIADDSAELSFRFSSFVYFRYSYVIAGVYKMNHRPFSEGVNQSLVMSAILMVFLLIFIALCLLFFIRRFTKKQEEAPKASLCCGIVIMVIAVILLTLSCVAAPMIFKDSMLLELLVGSSTEILDSMHPTVSGNIIVFVVFAGALLALEIVWKILSKKHISEASVN
ncbi:MAG: zinc ribbon domain-containing protein [Anaeroplasmataceae bacterium]|nr:zinc ribbon domain-containing protein [Anaeroplasmataceae bacterium]